LAARAVANRTDATFIRVIGSELVQKYVGEGARMVRELFQMARQKKACIIFFDEIDAIGGYSFVSSLSSFPLFLSFVLRFCVCVRVCVCVCGCIAV
jgi:ATP-dependent 26S proteasome regulatory subunit